MVPPTGECARFAGLHPGYYNSALQAGRSGHRASTVNGRDHPPLQFTALPDGAEDPVIDRLNTEFGRSTGSLPDRPGRAPELSPAIHGAGFVWPPRPSPGGSAD